MKMELQEDQLQDPVLENPLEKENVGEVKKKNPLLFIILGLLVLLILGFFLVRVFSSKGKENAVVKEEQPIEEVLAPVDPSIQVDLTKSKTKDNTVVITVKGLGGKYTSIGYELQYESGGVGKGVTSGSKPLDVTGQDTFEREIYLGTCSKNVCKPDLGVTKVALVLEFTDKDNKKSQFSKDYEL
ncbi:TPA: hypothetical protein DIS60_05950 [Patescibacteria group bacterium]|nr:hypothetical protein [Patescibacteria group bacterium]